MFESASDAVQAAIAATRALGAEPWPNDWEHHGPLRDPHRRGRAARCRLLRPDGQPRGARARAGRRRRDPPVAARSGSDARAPSGGLLARRPRPPPPPRGRGHADAPCGRRPRRDRAPARDRSAPTAGCWRSTRTTASSSSGARTCCGSVLERLAPRRLLALVGASGSGKSSLLRAGLIASVDAGEVPGVAGARLLQPGPHPPAEIDGDAATLVVVDQFEELYTLCHDPGARRALHRRAARTPGTGGDRRARRLLRRAERASRARGRGGLQPDPARRDERGRAAPRGDRAGAARRAAARAGARRRRARRGRRRARRPAAALARAARDLGAARRPHAHHRRLPRQRRRDLGRRAVGGRARRVGPRRGAPRCCATSSCG